ncbi:hypothetical protein GCM10027059_32800 [Myceligenerans halotolerans]
MDTLSRTRCPALRARDVRSWEEAAGPAHLRWMSRQHRPSPRPVRHTTLPATGYFTPQQAAELLGVSVHTLEKWRRAGYEGVGRPDVGDEVSLAPLPVTAEPDEHRRAAAADPLTITCPGTARPAEQASNRPRTPGRAGMLWSLAWWFADVRGGHAARTEDGEDG